jgi:3-hydroxybutyryl-CoA dehydrogenase
VVLNDIQSAILESYHHRARSIAELLADPEHPVDAILDNVTCASDLKAAVESSFLVQEVIQEKLEPKQGLFATLDRIRDLRIVLARITRHYLLTTICRDVTRRERVIGIHYVTPAHIIRAVEICPKSIAGVCLARRCRIRRFF